MICINVAISNWLLFAYFIMIPTSFKFKMFYNFLLNTFNPNQKEYFVALSSLSKILILSTAEGLGHPIWFHIFFILTFLRSSWQLLFTPGVLWLVLFLKVVLTTYKIKCSQLNRIFLEIDMCSCNSKLLYGNL